MTHIELRTKVGPDGVLSISVPVGIGETNRDVKVVVETLHLEEKKAADMTPDEWKQFIVETTGSWQGDFERPEQGEYGTRDTLS